MPSAPPATLAPIAIAIADGGELVADIWFRAFGVRAHSEYLEGGALADRRDERGYVCVDEHLRVVGETQTFALGDLADGAGGGTIFRGAVGTVMSIAPPDGIAESLAGMFLAAFVGISLPVVGAGITLSRHVSPKDTILGFAIAVSAGIAASAIKLVGRTTTWAAGGPTAAGRGADSPDGEPGHQPIDKPKERRAA